MPNETLNEMPARNSVPVEMPAPTSPAAEFDAREAASPVEMPSPDPHSATGGVTGVQPQSASLTSGELTSTGARPQTAATTETSGVSMMLAKAKNLEECSEIQAVGSGFIVTRKPVGTCRKEVPRRHMPAESTISTASSTMVDSNIESDLSARRESLVGDKGEEEGMSSSQQDVPYHPLTQPTTSAPSTTFVSSNTESTGGHDPDVGNAAEDEMTMEPEGDIY